MKIHNGDLVVINTGKDKGKQGTVLRVLESKNRVVVEGINMRVRHIKKTAQSAGQRISYEASIHASNVQILTQRQRSQHVLVTRLIQRQERRHVLQKQVER